MKLSVSTAKLKRAVDLASHVATTNSMTPILENVLLDAKFKKLLVVGNNLEMAVECSIDEDITINVEGSYTVSSKFLSSYLSLVHEDRIEIELVSGGMIRLKTTSGESKYKGIDAGKFPVIPACKGSVPVKIKGADMRKALERTMFSTASASIRPTLAGVHVKISEESIIFASTDSFRLSEYILTGKTGIEKQVFTIPTKTVSELMRMVGDDDTVEILVDASQALFTIGDVKLFSSLLANNFPDYQNFFPKKHQSKAVMLRSELTMAVKRLNLIARENNSTTRFHLKAQTGLEINTGDTEIGAADVRIPASIEGTDASVGLNAAYLLDVLSVIKTEHVSIDFETPLSPVMIRGVPSESAKESYRHIIMPLKI